MRLEGYKMEARKGPRSKNWPHLAYHKGKALLAVRQEMNVVPPARVHVWNVRRLPPQGEMLLSARTESLAGD